VLPQALGQGDELDALHRQVVVEARVGGDLHVEQEVLADDLDEDAHHLVEDGVPVDVVPVDVVPVDVDVEAGVSVVRVIRPP